MPKGLGDFGSLSDDKDRQASDDTSSGDFDADSPSDSVTLYVTNVSYTEEDGRPVIHLYGRDEDNQCYHVESSGHRPSFYVPTSEYSPQVTNHYAVYDVEDEDENGNPYVDPKGRELVRIYTYLPKQVRDLREQFTETYEADVFYNTRWLIDQDIWTGVEISLPDDDQSTGSMSSGREGWGSRAEDGVAHIRVDVDDINPAEPPTVDVRTIITDIEVASEAGMPDASEAQWPVSTIVAYDSYDDEYVGWILEHEDHEPFEVQETASYEAGLDELRPFEDESDMLDDYNEYIRRRRPDMLSGWHSNGFDYRYLINRCRNLDTWSFKNWSPTGEVYIANWNNEPVVKGVTMFDMLAGYDKTMRGEYSGKLDDVAKEELGSEKIEVEEGHTEMWKNDPVTFLEYNKRDVELVKNIENEKGIIKLYRQIRTLSGGLFDDCHAPIDMLDVYFLRKAREYGIVLPTATKNEQSWFYGAKVLDSQPGIHNNVLYFDLASLYPNLIKQLNVGPETLVGYESDDYEGDTVHSYFDDRTENVKKESPPQGDLFHYVDPQEQESFIRQATDDVIELKEPYRGTDMYIAVKMTVNAIWGVLGDGDSYGGKGFRLFDRRMGESITLAGRRVLLFTKDRSVEKFEERGYEAQAVLGDTDGCGISVEGVESQERLIEVAHEIAEEINDEYGDFLEDEFNSDENFMEVEVESLADKLFIPHGATTKNPKKRYAQRYVWNDDDGWDIPEDEQTDITGLEYVRSDTAEATRKAQKRFVDEILYKPLGEAKESYYAWLRAYVNGLKSGDEPISDLARPKGMTKSPWEYGTPNKTPAPTYRGAKYANQFIYEGEKLQAGDNPYLYYVKHVSGNYPVRYPRDWDTADANTKVDAVSLDEPEDLPDEIEVDVEKMIEKVLKKPLSRLFGPLGWDFDAALSDTDQQDITDFM